MQLRDSGFVFRGVNLMLLPTTTCCSHDTPLFRMSTLDICTGRPFKLDCLNCQPTIGWWSTSSSGGEAPADVSTLTTLPVSVTRFSKKFVGISCGDVNFLNWNKYESSPTLRFTVICNSDSSNCLLHANRPTLNTKLPLSERRKTLYHNSNVDRITCYTVLHVSSYTALIRYSFFIKIL